MPILGIIILVILQQNDGNDGNIIDFKGNTKKLKKQIKQLLFTNLHLDKISYRFQNILSSML